MTLIPFDDCIKSDDWLKSFEEWLKHQPDRQLIQENAAAEWGDLSPQLNGKLPSSHWEIAVRILRSKTAESLAPPLVKASKVVDTYKALLEGLLKTRLLPFDAWLNSHRNRLQIQGNAGAAWNGLTQRLQEEPLPDVHWTAVTRFLQMPGAAKSHRQVVAKVVDTYNAFTRRMTWASFCSRKQKPSREPILKSKLARLAQEKDPATKQPIWERFVAAVKQESRVRFSDWDIFAKWLLMTQFPVQKGSQDDLKYRLINRQLRIAVRARISGVSHPRHVRFCHVKPYSDWFRWARCLLDDDLEKEAIPERVFSELRSKTKSLKATFHRFCIYAFFEEFAPAESALPANPSSKDIVDLLALPHDWDKVKLVAFEFQTDSGPLIPSIWEAFSGGLQDVYFFPSNKGERIGRTKPHDSRPGVPEVVFHPPKIPFQDVVAFRSIAPT